MCSGCQRRIEQYYGDNEVYELAERRYKQHEGILGCAGGALHCVLEDENLELHHLYAALHDIETEQWRRTTKNDYNFMAHFSDEHLRVAGTIAAELVTLAEKKLGINRESEWEEEE